VTLTKPLVLGASGQLGSALTDALTRAGADTIAPARAALDLTRVADLERFVADARPTAVLNAAAYTDVAAAELPENRELAFRLNRDLPAELARICRARRIALVHVSTDYVFDGRSERPYREDDPANPLQVYGASKLAGEDALRAEDPLALIVRTSTLFGAAPRSRLNFVDAILAQARTQDSISVVVPPRSSPTYAPDLAGGILALLARQAVGCFHVTNGGECSRLELAREIVSAAGRGSDVRVERREPAADGLVRPEYSVLDNARFHSATDYRLRAWQHAVREHVQRRS